MKNCILMVSCPFLSLILFLLPDFTVVYGCAWLQYLYTDSCKRINDFVQRVSIPLFLFCFTVWFVVFVIHLFGYYYYNSCGDIVWQVFISSYNISLVMVCSWFLFIGRGDISEGGTRVSRTTPSLTRQLYKLNGSATGVTSYVLFLLVLFILF